METQETQAPLVVIHRPTELEGSGWMNVRQAAFRTSCCAATIRKACRAASCDTSGSVTGVARFGRDRIGWTPG
jgi:hypothetical protein